MTPAKKKKKEKKNITIVCLELETEMTFTFKDLSGLIELMFKVGKWSGMVEHDCNFSP